MPIFHQSSSDNDASPSPTTKQLDNDNDMSDFDIVPLAVSTPAKSEKRRSTRPSQSQFRRRVSMMVDEIPPNDTPSPVDVDADHLSAMLIALSTTNEEECQLGVRVGEVSSTTTTTVVGAEDTVDECDIHKLLAFCGQDDPISLAKLVTNRAARKIGEATFSEVFVVPSFKGNKNVVLKVITPTSVNVASLLHELRLTQVLRARRGFIKLYGCVVIIQHAFYGPIHLPPFFFCFN
jgi:hypothetical protein